MFYSVSVCDNIESSLGILVLRICQPCSALNFKDAGNKMTEHDSIFFRKLLNQISVERLIFCKAGQNSGVTAPLLQPLVAIG